MNGVICNESDHTAFILLVLHGKFGNCKKENYDLADHLLSLCLWHNREPPARVLYEKQYSIVFLLSCAF